MRLLDTPFANSDAFTKGQKFTLEVEHYGQTKTVAFTARYDRGDEWILVSDEDVAYCSVGGKCWPCPLEITVMTTAGRARDAQYPARKSIPTVNLWRTTNRLNRNYPVAGWWCDQAERNRSRHLSA